MGKKGRYLYAEVDGILETKQRIANLSSVMEKTLSDQKVLRKTSNVLTIQGLDQQKIRDIVLDRIREKL